MRGIVASLIAVVSPLAACWAADPPPRITVHPQEGIEFSWKGHAVGRYVVAPAAPKPHFLSLMGPQGRRLTRGFPMLQDIPGESKDHPHHRAVWFCHGDVIPEGLELKQKVRGVEGVDFWSESPGHGRIVCVGVAPSRHEGEHAWVVTRNEWRTADGQKILDEVRTLHLHDLGPAYLLSFDIELAASVVPIVFGDTKEGSFAVRVADALTERRQAGGVLENADGRRTEAQCWGRRSAWCDYSGPLEGRTVGLAVLDDPGNPHAACWHARGYGLLAANPFGRAKSGFPDTRGRTDLVRLGLGERLRLRYGIVVHEGDAQSGKVAQHYQRFVELARKERSAAAQENP
jgi:hypothetical protein